MHDGTHMPYSINNDDSVDSLLAKYDGVILPSNGDAVNAMRKKFENLLHEFAKILVTGVQEETSNLIEQIIKVGNGLYCYTDGGNIYTHFDLIKKISTLAHSCPQHLLQSKIINLFQKYDCNNQIPWISETIKNLKTYQKVILHQGSHDQIGSLPVISSKEIAITLDLMRKLEEIAKRNSSSFPYFI